jgi:predicted Zn-dependent protease
MNTVLITSTSTLIECKTPIRRTSKPKPIRAQHSTSLCAPRSGSYNTRSNKMTQAQKSRREMLEQFVAKRPTDAFARYGLAMECANTGDDEAAASHFQHLVQHHPEYVAAYYQYGQFLARQGREAEARKLLSDGIVVAQGAGDIHARDEMQAALNSLR